MLLLFLFIIPTSSLCPFDFHICVDISDPMQLSEDKIKSYSLNFYQRISTYETCILQNENILIKANSLKNVEVQTFRDSATLRNYMGSIYFNNKFSLFLY